MNLWQMLPKPIIGISPMDGVTDIAYRSILASYGKPHIMFTEFVHVMALWHGKVQVFDTLRFENIQRPIIAQIFGTQPEYFYKTAHIICQLGFDGIDINMGCPANTVIRRGGGAQLIKTPNLAQKIVIQTKKGVQDWVKGQTLENLDLDKNKIKQVNKYSRLDTIKDRQPIPVSVKTRIGYEHNTISEWIKYLIDTKPNAITVHGRTLKQLYGGKADWDAIGSVSREVFNAGIVYLGNGDVQSVEQAHQKCIAYNLDGALIGRATLGNPWIFNIVETDSRPQPVSTKEKLNVLLEHTRLHNKYYSKKQFPALKKHLGWYCTGFDGAKNLRSRLMACNNYHDVEEVIFNVVL